MSGGLRSYAMSFNPRPRVEGDICSSSIRSTGPMFQSAPSRGGRFLSVDRGNTI